MEAVSLQRVPVAHMQPLSSCFALSPPAHVGQHQSSQWRDIKCLCLRLVPHVLMLVLSADACWPMHRACENHTDRQELDIPSYTGVAAPGFHCALFRLDAKRRLVADCALSLPASLNYRRAIFAAAASQTLAPVFPLYAPEYPESPGLCRFRIAGLPEGHEEFVICTHAQQDASKQVQDHAESLPQFLGAFRCSSTACPSAGIAAVFLAHPAAGSRRLATSKHERPWPWRPAWMGGCRDAQDPVTCPP